MLIWLKNQGKVRYRTFQLRCAEGHGPVIDCAKEAFFAGQDLLDMGTGDVPRSFAAMLMRYLPGMYMQYGQGDKDVAKLEQMVRSSLSTSSQG